MNLSWNFRTKKFSAILTTTKYKTNTKEQILLFLINFISENKDDWELTRNWVSPFDRVLKNPSIKTFLGGSNLVFFGKDLVLWILGRFFWNEANWIFSEIIENLEFQEIKKFWKFDQFPSLLRKEPLQWPSRPLYTPKAKYPLLKHILWFPEALLVINTKEFLSHESKSL